MSEPKEGDLRVWHIPQVPGKAFRVPVVSLKEAKKLLDVLADYDAFQYKNRIKGDYSNVSGLEVFDEEGQWVTWCSADGDEIDDLDYDSLTVFSEGE